MNKNDETIDLLDSFPKYEKYKKLYGRGNNFNFKFIITPETRGGETPGLNYNGTVDWQELRYVYKVSRVDLVELIEKKSIIHTYKSPDSDTKIPPRQFCIDQDVSERPDPPPIVMIVPVQFPST